MSNDKKPKKAKAPIVHGATHKGSDLSSRLTAPVANTVALVDATHTQLATLGVTTWS